MRGRVRPALALALALVTVVTLPSAAYTRPGPTTLVSLSPDGHRANTTGQDVHYGPVVSADGRYVAFATAADNLVPNDTNKSTDVFRRDLRTGRTALVSVGLDGKPGLASCGREPISWSPSISANGRYVAFTSCSSDLIAGDTYPGEDVFVRDMVKGVTTLVSVSATGVQSPIGGQSGFQAISGNGRYVAFTSFAPLTPLTQPNSVDQTLGATVNAGQVYVRDVVARTTTLASASATGEAGDSSSGGCGYRSTAAAAGISANGRYVVFTSSATNLAAGAVADGGVLSMLDRQSGVSHVYVHDLRSRTTVMADVADDGTPASAPQPLVLARCLPSGDPSISADGRLVSFTSSAQNLIPDAGHHEVTIPVASDVFVRDLRARRTLRVDVTSAGENPRSSVTGTGSGMASAISADGRYVVFDSDPLGGPFRHDLLTGATEPLPSPLRPGAAAVTMGDGRGFAELTSGRFVAFTGYAPGDTSQQVYLRDFGPDVGVGGLAGSGALTVAGRAGFADSGVVASTAPAADIDAVTAARGADLVGASLVYRPAAQDLLFRELLQRMTSVNDPTAAAGLLYGVDLTANGVRYQIRVQRVPGPSYDAAGGASFGLFRLESGGWSEVATLRGGYGTTGAGVVFAVPLTALGLARGGRIAGVTAFTAVGSYPAGVARTVDQVVLAAA
jgi:Tol biopolymer transport system component